MSSPHSNPRHNLSQSSRARCRYHIGFRDPNCIHCRHAAPVRLPTHGHVKWKIEGASCIAVCRCGAEFMSGTRWVKGDPREAMMALKAHISAVF